MSRRLLVTWLLLGAFVLVACGGRDEVVAPAAEATTVSQPPTAEPEEPEEVEE